MKTIARNRAKFLAQLQASLTDCQVYDRDSGQMIPTDPANAWRALAASRNARLVESTDRDRYTVHVHSNLFYVLRPAS